MNKELRKVIEDNLVQLRYDTESAIEEDAVEAEGRLLNNLAVLVAAGEVSHPSSLCAEVLTRIDEIRLQSGATLEVLDPRTVRQDMGSHRFTYLYLHQGEVQACHEVIKTEARPTHA